VLNLQNNTLEAGTVHSAVSSIHRKSGTSHEDVVSSAVSNESVAADSGVFEPLSHPV